MATRTTSKDNRGLTLIELQIVIAIMAIIAAVTVPSIQSERQNLNEIDALASLNDIVVGQSQFAALDPDGDLNPDVAASLHMLGGVRYIDDELGNGQKSGYIFTLGAGAPTPGVSYEWDAEAKPASKKINGRRSFYVDETGVIRESYRSVAGEGDPPAGTLPTPTPAADLDKLQRLAVAAIEKLNKQADGQALSGAQTFVTNPFIRTTILNQLDHDDDNSIRFAESLGPDILSLARKVIQTASVPNPGPAVGPDEDVDKVTRDYLRKVGGKLRFASCEANPNVPIAALNGDPAALLDEAQ